MITAKNIAEFLETQKVWGDLARKAEGFANLIPGEANALSFCKLHTSKSLSMVQESQSAIIICPDTLQPVMVSGKTLIPVLRPRLAFARVVNRFFSWRSFEPGIHDTAVIGAGAKIHPSSYIGPYCIIGERAVIGENTVLCDRVTVFRDCRVGSSVLLASGVVIGFEGLGHSPDEEGSLVPFPQVGSVVIQDDVEVGANTCIDRGALGDTIIGRGTKIDNLVHIAHNVNIGRNCFITCQVGIAGSVTIGDDSYLGVGALIRNQLTVGRGTMIGMGAVVVKDVPDGITVIGNPARPMNA